LAAFQAVGVKAPRLFGQMKVDVRDDQEFFPAPYSDQITDVDFFNFHSEPSKTFLSIRSPWRRNTFDRHRKKEPHTSPVTFRL
jgi:hypothetical protein